MLEETQTYQPKYVFRVVVPLISDFFLQHRSDGNYGGKRVPEDQELQEELPAQMAESRCQDNSCDSYGFYDWREQLEHPQIRKRKAANPSVARSEEHVPVGPQHV